MIQSIKSLRSCLARLAAAALAFAVLGGATPVPEDPIYAGWFRYGERVNQSWLFAEVDGDPMQVTIRRKNPSVHAPPKRVFVIYPRPSSAYDAAITRILEVFEEKGVNAEMRVFNFAKDDARGKEAIRAAEAGGYDLIFSMGSESTAWLYQNYRDGAIPVVSVCSKDPVLLGQARDYESGSGTNFAFTSLNMPVEVQMAYVLKLKPGLKNLAILVNSKNVSAMQTQAEPIADYARRRGIRVLDVAIEDPKNARAELARMLPEAVAAMRKNDPGLNNSVFWITGSTAVFREIATINAHADRVPVLSVVPDVVRAGEDSAVLSIGVSFDSNAHLAAIYGADVLAGRAEVGALKVGVASPPDIAINFHKAREIGLKIPFSFFESASFVYDYEGQPARVNGKSISRTRADR